MSKIQVLTEAEFNEKIGQSEKPVVIDFSATWCGPCKMLEPVVEKLSEEWVGKAEVYKIDIDQTPSIAQNFQVMGVPTLMLFKNGEVVASLVGFKTKRTIAKKFEAHF